MDQLEIMKRFELELEYGPYFHCFSRNGTQLLLAGARGHISMIDWKRAKLITELSVEETVTDVTQLFDKTMFAVAQEKRVFVYDNQGVEIHAFVKKTRPCRLAYLPYHFLLCSVGETGLLTYNDVSTGEEIACIRTKLGPCSVMTQNPYNAVLHLGHSNGNITLWAPTSNEPLVRLLAHRGPLRAIDFDVSGHYMVSSGIDKRLKIWDIRKFDVVLKNKRLISSSNCLSVSQTGILATADGTKIDFFKDCFTKPLSEPIFTVNKTENRINRLQFCPYEDVLGVSHIRGFSLVPMAGTGQRDFDTFEVDPYESKKKRQNRVVRNLLEKLRPEHICLDPDKFATVQDEEIRNGKGKDGEKDKIKDGAKRGKDKKRDEDENKVKVKRKKKKRKSSSAPSQKEFDKRARMKRQESLFSGL